MKDSAAAVHATQEIRARVAALVPATSPLDYLPNVSVSTGAQPFTDICRTSA